MRCTERAFQHTPNADQRKLTDSCAEIIAISRKAEIPIVQVTTSRRPNKANWPTAWKVDESWCASLAEDNDLSGWLME